jgi:CHAT domain-containing protein
MLDSLHAAEKISSRVVGAILAKRQAGPPGAVYSWVVALLTVFAIGFVHSAPMDDWRQTLVRYCEISEIAKDVADVVSANRSINLTTPPLDLHRIAANSELARIATGRADYWTAETMYRDVLVESIKNKAAYFETANALIDLGLILQWRSQYVPARSMYLCASAMRTRVQGSSHPQTVMANARLAELDRELGKTEAARVRYEELLTTLEGGSIKGPEIEAFVVTGLAHSLKASGPSHYSRALSLYRRALTLYEGHPACSSECDSVAIASDALGSMLLDLEQIEESKTYLLRAMSIKERLRGPHHDTTATTAQNLARLNEKLGNRALALGYFRRAVLAVYAPLDGAAAKQSATLSRLAEFSAELGRFLETAPGKSDVEEAIFFYKLSVNARQRMRSGAKGLDSKYRDALKAAVTGPYVRLASLLADSGRLAEAEQVMLLLKDAELAEFTRGNASTDADPVGLTPAETTLVAELNLLAGELAATYAEIDARTQNAASPDPTVLKRLIEKRDALQHQLLANLNETANRVKRKGGAITAMGLTPDTRLSRLVNKLSIGEFGESNAVLIFIPEERVTTVIVVGRSGPSAMKLSVGAGDIDARINSFRIAIQEKKPYKKLAQELHKDLIAPVLAHIVERKMSPTTLMLSLSGRLRYLPFAALVDDQGKHFVSKFRLSILTAAGVEKADADPMKTWTVTAFGSTLAAPHENLSALPAVAMEIDALVRSEKNPLGMLEGEKFMDAKFTVDEWKRFIDATPGGSPARKSVIHVATHFETKPGDWGNSFLLLGTGDRFPVSELKNRLTTNLEDIDLLTLSACSTEFADQANGTEFEGLGALFQTKGVRSVIGTLWRVQDDGGAALTTAFYKARGEERNMSKAAALQDAQVKMISGTIISPRQSIDLTHPYYWAPFVLMGNWR